MSRLQLGFLYAATFEQRINPTFSFMIHLQLGFYMQPHLNSASTPPSLS
jgi:hypothetical protein